MGVNFLTPDGGLGVNKMIPITILSQGDESPVQEQKDQHQDGEPSHQPCQRFDVRLAFFTAPSKQCIPAIKIHTEPNRFPHILSPFGRSPFGVYIRYTPYKKDAVKSDTLCGRGRTQWRCGAAIPGCRAA